MGHAQIFLEPLDGNVGDVDGAAIATGRPLPRADFMGVIIPKKQLREIFNLGVAL